MATRKIQPKDVAQSKAGEGEKKVSTRETKRLREARTTRTTRSRAFTPGVSAAKK